MPLDQQNTPDQTGGLNEVQLAQATDAEAIGSVNVVAGRVEVIRTDGTRETLEEGMSIFQGDTIETGGNGTVGMVFVDDSTFSMSENGQMVIDEMVYDASAQEGSAALNVVQGVFTLVSGEIAKTGVDAMVLETPTAVIGIRGTTVAGKVTPPEASPEEPPEGEGQGNLGIEGIKEFDVASLSSSSATQSMLAAGTSSGPIDLQTAQFAPAGGATDVVLLPDANGDVGEFSMRTEAGFGTVNQANTGFSVTSSTQTLVTQTFSNDFISNTFTPALNANAGSGFFSPQAVQQRSTTLPDTPPRGNDTGGRQEANNDPGNTDNTGPTDEGPAPGEPGGDEEQPGEQTLEPTDEEVTGEEQLAEDEGELGPGEEELTPDQLASLQGAEAGPPGGDIVGELGPGDFGDGAGLFGGPSIFAPELLGFGGLAGIGTFEDLDLFLDGIPDPLEEVIEDEEDAAEDLEEANVELLEEGDIFEEILATIEIEDGTLEELLDVIEAFEDLFEDLAETQAAAIEFADEAFENLQAAIDSTFDDDDDDDDDQGITVVEADSEEIFGTLGFDDIFGNALDNTIYSSFGDDIIFGEGGTDTVTYSSIVNGNNNFLDSNWYNISVQLEDDGSFSIFKQRSSDPQDYDRDVTDSVETFIGTFNNDTFQSYNGSQNFNDITFQGYAGDDRYILDAEDTGTLTILDTMGSDDRVQMFGNEKLVSAYRDGTDLVLDLADADVDSTTPIMELTLSGHYSGNAIEFFQDGTSGPLTELTDDLDASGAGTDALVVGTSDGETLSGGDFADVIFAGDGDDIIRGRAGNNEIYGEDGTDEVSYDWSSNAISTSASGSNEGNWTIQHGAGQADSDMIFNVEHITGGSAGDTLSAVGAGSAWSSTTITLEGLDGADNLTGSAGDDILIGGAGNDVIIGGGGNDRFYFQNTETSGVAGAIATVTTLGMDTLTATNEDQFILVNEIFGLGTSGFLADLTNYFETANASENFSASASQDAIVLVGDSSGTDGVDVYFTVDAANFDSTDNANSYQIATINGLNTGDLSSSDFELGTTI